MTTQPTNTNSKTQPPPAAGAEPQWNKPGHGVVAFIAETILREDHPAAWQKIADALDADPLGRASMSKAARWPDDMKSDPDFKARTGAWHYVDILWEEGTEPSATAPLPEPPHALTKMPDFEAEFASDDAETRATAIAWLAHVVGDLHMPLHCISRTNDEFPPPEGDRGGNGFVLRIGTKNVPLHSYWDGLLIFGDRTPEAVLRDLAADIIEEIPASSFADADLSSAPEVWAREGHAIAARNAYAGVEPGAAPSNAYEKKAKQIARKRAALGGYRLARTLERLADAV